MARRAPNRPEGIQNPENYSSGNSPVLDTPERALQFCFQIGAVIDETIVDIESLIEQDQNLELRFEDLGPKDASIGKTEGDKYHIRINSKHPKTRQRFSMAHEYAHYQLHKHDLKYSGSGQGLLFRDNHRDPKEYLANSYAASLLMPEWLVLEVIEKNTNSDFITLISSKFMVSTLAAKYRLMGLGVISND